MSKNLTTNRRRLRRTGKRSLGTVAIEMAVVLPVFLIIFLGFIEIARLSFAVNSTQVALIKSGRALSLPNATADGGKEAALEYLQKVGIDTEHVAVTVTPEDFTAASSEVTVQIQFEMSPVPYPINRSLTRSRE